MPFYRKKLTYDEIAPLMQKFRLWMRGNCPVIQELTDESSEVFLITPEQYKYIKAEYYELYSLLRTSRYATVIPVDRDYAMMYWNKTADGPETTVTKGYIRLPKLSHLITLVPQDFFLLLRLITTAKNTPTGDAFSLDPMAAGIQVLQNSYVYHFFTKLRVNFRMNTEYADKKWTKREELPVIANLDPTTENHMYAMQYLTALQNDDILYFPADTNMHLQLDWEVQSDEYCVSQFAADPIDDEPLAPSLMRKMKGEFNE